jgi:hypothetical protein
LTVDGGELWAGRVEELWAGRVGGEKEEGAVSVLNGEGGEGVEEAVSVLNGEGGGGVGGRFGEEEASALTGLRVLARGWGVCLRPGLNHAAGVIWAPELQAVIEGVWALERLGALRLAGG